MTTKPLKIEICVEGIDGLVAAQNAGADRVELCASLIEGDCRDGETLRAAGVQGARGVLVMTDDDLVNVSTTLQVRDLDEKVRSAEARLAAEKKKSVAAEKDRIQQQARLVDCTCHARTRTQQRAA